MPTALNHMAFTTSAAEPINIAAAIRPRQRYSKDTLLFLHGLGCASSQWEPLMEMAVDIAPALNTYQLISINLPGHGNTPAVPGINPMGAWRDTIIDVLDTLLATDIVHLIAHSASTPLTLQAMQHVDEYLHPDREGSLGSLLSLEGNHTLADAGLISRRIADQFRSWYCAGGHLQIQQELRSSGHIESVAWARMWARADPDTVWGIARGLCQDLDYVELADYWNAYPYRGYLNGQQSTVPTSTRTLMGAPYPDPPTVRYEIPAAGHFPMVTAPAETLHIIATALEDLESCR